MQNKTDITTRGKGRPIGRPTIRTAAKAKKICAALARGAPKVFACRVAGVSNSAFCEWKNADEKFREHIEQAVALGVDKRLKTIEKAARLDWRAASWLLEHTQPEHFAKSRIQVEAVGTFGTFSIPPETLNEIAEARAVHERELNGGTPPPALPAPAPQNENDHEPARA